MPAILIAGFVLAIGYSLAEITWLALDDRSDVGIPRHVKPLLSSKTTAVDDFYGREIAEWDLFGVATATKKATDEKVELTAPDTRLQLALKGVYVAPSAEKSSAIIAEKRNVKRYRIGDRVPGGVSLHEVQNKFVILKRGAKYETLRFTDSSLKAPITAKPRTVKKASRRSGSERRGIVNDIRSGKITSVTDILNDYGANPAEQFAAVLMEAGMESINEDGESGLKVGRSAPKDILKSIGLRSGDIVRSVNGFPVNELQGDDALLREVLTSERAKIVIQRGSRRFTVNYPLPQG